MAENAFLVNVQDHLAWFVITWISKAMTRCRQQDRDGVPLQVATLFHWIHQTRLKFIQTGWKDTVRHKCSLTSKQTEVCADLSQALCIEVINTCHNLLWSKCPLFCKISGFSPLSIYILWRRLVASGRFWGLILQVFQRMNVLLNAPFISANELCWEMPCIQTASTVSTFTLYWRPHSRDFWDLQIPEDLMS